MAERDEKGLFLPGSTGNPKGRPKKKTEDRLFDMLADKMDDVRLSNVLDALIDGAEKGEYRKLELLMAYLAGKPLQRVEHSGDNPIAAKFDEWKAARLEAIREFMAQQQAPAPAVVVVDDPQSILVTKT